MWIRARKCNCIPQRLAEVRISNLEANPGRMYYKYKFCNLFKWVSDSKMSRVGGECNIYEDYTQVQRSVQILIEIASKCKGVCNIHEDYTQVKRGFR